MESKGYYGKKIKDYKSTESLTASTLFSQAIFVSANVSLHLDNVSVRSREENICKWKKLRYNFLLLDTIAKIKFISSSLVSDAIFHVRVILCLRFYIYTE